MDCETFESTLIDLVYDELDEVRTRALERHAEGCPSCAAKLAEMRATRERAPRSYLIEEPPSGFENRILAAVDEALSKKAPVPVKEEPKGGAKIFAFVARPQFAIAAAFLLVLGAAVVFTSQSSMKASSVAQSAPEARGGEGQAAKEESAPAATATAAASAVAQMDPAPPPVATPTMAYNAPAEAKKVAGASASCVHDLPRLEGLAKTSPSADLEAARCIAATQGCKVAVTRLDNVAKKNAGTETGSRATLEAARCYESMNDMTNARSRYTTLSRDNYVADEANFSLNNLESRAKAGPAPATATARPPAKKAAPSASPPSNVNVLE